MSEVSRPRHHNCYEHDELINNDNIFDCDGCKMKGHGERYQCRLCRQELHIECRNPKATITHEYFPGSLFKFLYETFTRIGKDNRREYYRWCNACGKDVRGFNYYCAADNLHLHPNCRNFKKTLSVSGVVFNLQAKASSKCLRCKKTRIYEGKRKVQSWSYVSTCKKHEFHVYCMMEVVHDINSGEVNLGQLTRRNTGSRKIFRAIKVIAKIAGSALLGDPTGMISHVFVEAFSR